MFINNESHVIGVFKFQPNTKYEKGDLVLDSSGLLYNVEPLGESLYAMAASESGIISENGFFPYLLSRVATLQDFLEESKSGIYSDKILSTESLRTILNYYNSGSLDDTGIISGYFDTISSTIAISNLYSSQGIPNESCLFRLMIDPNINTGVYKVHRNLKEIEAATGSTEMISGDNSWCVLKQYTYKTGSNLCRLQELIDPINPSIYYRSVILKMKDGNINGDIESYSGIPDFLAAYINESGYIQKLRNALRVTLIRLKELDDTMSRLTSNFRYRSINIQNKLATILHNNSSYPIGQLDSRADLSNLYFTVQVISTGSPKESFNIPVSTSGLTKELVVSYKISDGSNMTIKYSSDQTNSNIPGGYSLSQYVLIVVPSQYQIQSVFYRQYFNV